MSAASKGVDASQRFTGSHACPICGGSDDDRRGDGSRCYGFLSGDGKYAHCTREDHAGEAPFNTKSKTYAHRMGGTCKCGREHGPDEHAARNGSATKRARRPSKVFPSLEEAAQFLHHSRSIGAVRTIVHPYQDRNGRTIGGIIRLQLADGGKTFRAASLGTDGRWRLKGMATPRPLYHLPDLADAPLVVVTEGEKACGATRTLGFVATTPPHGAESPHLADWSPLAGKEVAIWLDNDEAGENFGMAVHAILDGLDPRPTIKLLRPEGMPPKGDAADFLEAGRTAEEVRRLIEEAEPLDPLESPPSRRPVIICDSMQTDEGFKKWTPKALDALVLLNRKEPSPVVYQRATQLARIRPGEGTESPGIEPLGLDALRGLLDRAADWGSVHHTKEGPETNFGPPRLDVCKDILALPGYGDTFPLLELIAESPRFLPDGSLILRPGYHKTGHIFYAPTPDLIGLEVPARVTDEDLEAARSLVIDELLVDFPFANQASRANAFALFLLPFARLLIDGPTPDHHVEASTEGTGKGLLAQACLTPSVGSEPAFTTPKEDDAEWRKLLTTVFMRGASYLILDNMANVVDPFTGDSRLVDSPSLASALTGTRWIDRKLGGNTEVNVLIRTVFASTGNNVEWSRELRRRLAPIQLLTPCEDPSTRTGFRHDPLLDWVRHHRRELVRAALVLIRRWFDDGCPEGRQVMGSFERYGRVMGGILGTIGVDGFLGNRKTGSVYDRERARWAMLTEAWAKQHATLPVRAKELVDLISGNQALSDVFADIIGEGSDLSKGQRMGRAIRRNINRVCGDWRIIAAGGHRTANVGLYKLCDPKEEIEEEDEGEESDLPF